VEESREKVPAGAKKERLMYPFNLRSKTSRTNATGIFQIPTSHPIAPSAYVDVLLSTQFFFLVISKLE